MHARLGAYLSEPQLQWLASSLARQYKTQMETSRMTNTLAYHAIDCNMYMFYRKEIIISIILYFIYYLIIYYYLLLVIIISNPDNCERIYRIGSAVF